MALKYNKIAGRDIKPIVVDLSQKGFKDLNKDEIEPKTDDDSEDTTIVEEVTDALIADVLVELKETGDDDDFTEDGKPKVSVINGMLSEQLGKAVEVSAEDRDRVWESINQ